MRLASIIPPLQEEILSALEQCGIKTDSDLLFNSGTAENIFIKLPSDSPITLREIQETISDVTTRTCAPVYRGDKLLTIETERRENLLLGEGLDSGVVELDRLVGCFGRYRVLEISGDTGSGKTVRIPT